MCYELLVNDLGSNILEKRNNAISFWVEKGVDSTDNYIGYFLTTSEFYDNSIIKILSKLGGDGVNLLFHIFLKHFQKKMWIFLYISIFPKYTS